MDYGRYIEGDSDFGEEYSKPFGINEIMTLNTLWGKDTPLGCCIGTSNEESFLPHQ